MVENVDDAIWAEGLRESIRDRNRCICWPVCVSLSLYGGVLLVLC